MKLLGVEPQKIRTIGNLKFGTPEPASQEPSTRKFFSNIPEKIIFLCGSTHPGEEQIVIDVYQELRGQDYSVHCVIAPRNIGRVEEISEYAKAADFSIARFSDSPAEPADVTIIDTIGDLASLYHSADIAFVGGSLVPEGGHNPLEAVRAGCPVMFGPHMDDFSEIAASMLDAGCGFEVKNGDELKATLTRLLSSDADRETCGGRASAFIIQHQDVIPEYINLIKQLM